MNISAEPRNDYFTVSEITLYIKRLVQSDKLMRSATVMGEVTGFTHYKSGHIYFSIKDENALLKCVFFRNYQKGDYNFLKDGAKVIIKGYIGVFEKRGEYQLYVSDISDFGRGNILLKLEELKKKLEAKGFFDQKYKKVLPEYPEKIGIVAAKDSAGLHDILKVFKERAFSLDIIIADSRVQGHGASKEIASTIKKLNNIDDLDLIIVARGGGAYEDLWAFNEEDVVEAIFSCRHPIITGIGHEIDITLADLVADKRAATPTQAAEIAFPDRIEVSKNISFIFEKMRKIALNIVEDRKKILQNNSPKYSYRIISGRLAQNMQCLDNLQLKLERSSYGMITENKNSLMELHSLSDIVNANISDQKYLLQSLKPNVYRKSVNDFIDSCHVKLTHCKRDMKNTIKSNFDILSKKTAHLSEKLGLLNPENVLKRGYIIVKKDDKIIKSSENLEKGNEIILKFHDSERKAEVLE